MRAPPRPKRAQHRLGPTGWLSLLAWLGLAVLAAGTSAAAEPERGVIAREAPLLARPYALGRPVATLAAGTPVAVVERRGYWLRVRAHGPPAEGWVRIIGVRRETSQKAAAPGERSAGLFSSLARSATGWLGRRPSAPRETTTVGIRGLNAAELRTASPDPHALERLERVAASPAAARAFARSGALEARAFTLRAPAARNPAGGSSDDEQLDTRM